MLSNTNIKTKIISFKKFIILEILIPKSEVHQSDSVFLKIMLKKIFLSLIPGIYDFKE